MNTTIITNQPAPVAVAPANSGDANTNTRAVVISTCHGGFSLSPLAVYRMAQLQGRSCYFFTDDYYAHPVALQELQNRLRWSAFDISNPAQLKEDEFSQHQLDNHGMDRDDPILVQVVRELGDKANGSSAKLKVVDIPADVAWWIDEYDGREWVSERHRKWC